MLQGTGGADPNKRVGTGLHQLLQRYDGRGAANAGAANRDGQPLIAAVDEAKLPVLPQHFALFELAGDAIDPGRVAAQYHPLGNLVGAALEMG